MKKAWRVVDTGLRSAAENIALNRALLEARQADEAPPTLRFLRFTPSALLGFHQSAEQELDLDYCHTHRVAIQRRITGGGAIYFDETQLGWELYLHKSDLGCADMQAISQRICTAAAGGMRALGVAAQYRPRNDIEVEGRKISGTGGAFDGDALLFQGTLLIQFDVEKMLRVLRIPVEKLSDKAIASARERVANLADLLGYVPALEQVQAQLTAAFSTEFNVEFVSGEISALEQARFTIALAEINHDDWVHLMRRPLADRPIREAAIKFPAGLVRVRVNYDQARHRIQQLWFTGDFFISPRRTIADLEACLRDSTVIALRSNIEIFFAQHKVDMLGLSAADFCTVIETALTQQVLVT